MDDKMPSQSVPQFVINSTKPFRWWIAAQFLVALIWAVDLSLSPYLLKVMIDRLSGLSSAHAYEVLLWPAFFYVAMSLIINITFRFYDYVWINLNHPLKRHIGFLLMDCMMAHSHQLYQNNFAGSLGTKIKDVMSGIPDFFKTVIDRFFSHALALVIAIGTAWTVNVKFAIALCVWVTIFLAGSFIFSRQARHLSRVSAEVRSTVVGTIVDILSNIMSVRLFTGHIFERKKLAEVLNNYVKADQSRDWFLSKMHVFQWGSFTIYQAISILLLIEGLKQGNISSGDFVLILTISLSIVNCLQGVAKEIGPFAELVGNITQGLKIVLFPLDITDKPDAQPLIVHQGEIIFDQVKFHYKDAKPFFQNKSITIPAGQKVGLVGYSGGGKTTFANLIVRLFDVTSGRILIDGQDICDVIQDSLRAQIGMIPQDPALFHRTLMENIRYGRLDASEEDAIDAAKKAHAHEFIAKLPQGYESLVGERGVKLSGGQRQRIAIARAILKNAPILILDEATSQLDSLTESNIQDSLWNLMQGKTTIVIAHRLSTLLHMDRILVFDQGHIVEDGTHQDLLAKGGLYKILWDAQVGGFLLDISDKIEGD
jgi:ATP-binding cassette subfamily B protein